MMTNQMGLAETLLSFLLSTGGMIFMAILLLAALALLFRTRNGRVRGACIAVILLCLLYVGLVLWLTFAFGSNGRPPRT